MMVISIVCRKLLILMGHSRTRSKRPPSNVQVWTDSFELIGSICTCFLCNRTYFEPSPFLFRHGGICWWQSRTIEYNICLKHLGTSDSCTCSIWTHSTLLLDALELTKLSHAMPRLWLVMTGTDELWRVSQDPKTFMEYSAQYIGFQPVLLLYVTSLRETLRQPFFHRKTNPSWLQKEIPLTFLPLVMVRVLKVCHQLASSIADVVILNHQLG